MKTTKLGVALLTLIICASAFAAPAPNSNKSSDASSKKPSHKPTLVFNRKLVSTSWHFDEPDTSIPGGLVASPIDSSLTFQCPHGGCTLTAELTVQVGGGSTDSNQWALCTTIDGTIMPPGACPFVGQILSDGSFTAGAFNFTQSGVTAGSHTIQSFVYSFDGGILANYDITYRLYTP